MSRSRTYAPLLDPAVYVRPNGGEPIYVGTMPFESSIATSSCSAYSNILDSTTPSGSRRVSNSCKHIKYNASMISHKPFSDWVYPGCPNVTWFAPRLGYLRADLPQVPTPNWAGLTSDLVSKLSGSIQEGSLLGVSLLELGKTVAMLRNPFNIMRTDWRQVVKKLTPRELAKSSANLWLEHRYGWNALYQDVKSFAKTYHKVQSRYGGDVSQYATERYSSSQEVTLPPLPVLYKNSDSDSWNGYLNGTSEPHQIYAVRITPSGALVRNSITVKQALPSLSFLDRAKRTLHAFGLSYQDILTTLWEIVPYSFVVDWFIDPRGIGYPMNLMRLSQADIRDSCFSTKVNYSYYSDLAVSKWALYYFQLWYAQHPQTASRVAKGTEGTVSVYERTAGLPPTGNFWENCISTGLSVTQGISAVALILQRMLK